jgi:hypothetical protein
VLAHANYPNVDNTPIEIHIDQDETWYLKIDGNTPEEQVNLFSVLLHEIGHALGISHSNNQDSIMYPYNDNKIELDRGDILAIQIYMVYLHNIQIVIQHHKRTQNCVN